MCLSGDHVNLAGNRCHMSGTLEIWIPWTRMLVENCVGLNVGVDEYGGLTWEFRSFGVGEWGAPATCEALTNTKNVMHLLVGCLVGGAPTGYLQMHGAHHQKHTIYIYIYMASVWLSGESNNLVHIWSDLVVANLHSNNSPFMCASQLCATQCLWREWCLCTTNRHYISYLHSPYPFPQFLIPCQPCLPCFLTLLSFNCTKYSYLITNSKCLA